MSLASDTYLKAVARGQEVEECQNPPLQIPKTACFSQSSHQNTRSSSSVYLSLPFTPFSLLATKSSNLDQSLNDRWLRIKNVRHTLFASTFFLETQKYAPFLGPKLNVFRLEVCQALGWTLLHLVPYTCIWQHLALFWELGPELRQESNPSHW